MTHRKRPPEPPIPHPEQFPRSYEAARRSQRPSYKWPAIVSALAAAAIAAVACTIVLVVDRPTGAADREVVVSRPTAQPGPQVPSCREAGR